MKMVVKGSRRRLSIEYTVSIKRFFIITSVKAASAAANSGEASSCNQNEGFSLLKKTYKPNLTTYLRILMEIKSR